MTPHLCWVGIEEIHRAGGDPPEPLRPLEIVAIITNTDLEVQHEYQSAVLQHGGAWMFDLEQAPDRMEILVRSGLIRELLAPEGEEVEAIDQFLAVTVGHYLTSCVTEQRVTLHRWFPDFARGLTKDGPILDLTSLRIFARSVCGLDFRVPLDKYVRQIDRVRALLTEARNYRRLLIDVPRAAGEVLGSVGRSLALRDMPVPVVTALGDLLSVLVEIEEDDPQDAQAR